MTENWSAWWESLDPTAATCAPLASALLVEGDRRLGERVDRRPQLGGAGLDLDRVDEPEVGLGRRVVPGAAAAEGRGVGKDRRVVDLGPAVGGADERELARRDDRILGPDQGRGRPGLESVHRPAAVVGEGARPMLVVVAGVGRHLGAWDDQPAGIVGLIAPRLAGEDIVVVVDDGDEVEPGAALGERPEGVVERVTHQGVARLLLAVGVQVARVPTRALARGRAVVGRPRVGIIRPRRVIARLHPHSPGDSVGVDRGADDRGEPELDRPLAGRDRSRLVGAGGKTAHVGLPRGLVCGRVREPVDGDREIADRAPAPAAPLGHPPARLPGRARLEDADVERVARTAGRLIEAIADPDRGAGVGDVEGDLHVGALPRGGERPGELLGRVHRRIGSPGDRAVGRCRGGSRERRRDRDRDRRCRSPHRVHSPGS